jgi:hypothetical protein
MVYCCASVYLTEQKCDSCVHDESQARGEACRFGNLSSASLSLFPPCTDAHALVKSMSPNIAKVASPLQSLFTAQKKVGAILTLMLAVNQCTHLLAIST